MKKITISLAVFVFFFQLANAQVVTDSLQPLKLTNKELGAQLFQKSNTQEAVGFVLLGVGVAAWIGGGISTLTNYNVFTGSGSGYVILTIAGIGATIASIPILIASHRTRKRANILLRTENISESIHLPIRGNIASIGMAISLR